MSGNQSSGAGSDTSNTEPNISITAHSNLDLSSVTIPNSNSSTIAKAKASADAAKAKTAVAMELGNLSSELSNMKLDPGKLVSPTIVVGATPVFSGNNDNSVHSPPSPLHGRRIEFEGGRKEGKSEEDNSKTIAALPPLILINPNGANDDEEDDTDTNNNNPVVKEDVSFDVLHNEYFKVCFNKNKKIKPGRMGKVYVFNHNKGASRFYVPADGALLVDVMFLLSEGKALNYSNEDHFLRCRERDINILQNKYAETDDTFDTKIPSIEDLLKECQKALTQVRGTTNAIGKNRIKNCLTKKNLNKLWKQKKAKPATVHPKGDVRVISKTLGAVYQMNNVDDTGGKGLLRPEFFIGMNTSAKVEKIKQHFRRTISKNWKVDMKNFGVNPETHTLPYNYQPPQNNPTVSPEVPEAICEKVEDEIRQLKEEYVSLLKEAGNHDEKFDEKEETKEEKYATVESHEKDEADHTRKQHEEYDEVMAFLETTELNVKNFNKAKDGQVNYKTIVGWFDTGLPKVNKKYGLDITPKQCFHFDQATYEKKKKQKKNSHVPRNLINKLVDTLHIRLKEKCRMRNCQNKPSDTDNPTELGGKWDQDHTDEGTSQHGAKADGTGGPSRIFNHTKKKEEKRKTLPTCKECHDVYNPTTRGTEKPLSRKRKQMMYEQGRTHHPGKEVITSFNMMNFVMDLLASGAISPQNNVIPFSERSLNAKCWIHLGMPLTMLNTDPTWKWDEKLTATNRKRMVNNILSNAALRLSERCANNECPKPDIVNSTTWAMGGAWHWDHDEGKDMDVSELVTYHPIHLLNEIMRWCAATCSGCHAIKTKLEKLGNKGRLFDKTLIPSCC